MNDYKPESLWRKAEIESYTFCSTLLVTWSCRRKLAIPGLSWFIPAADLEINSQYGDTVFKIFIWGGRKFSFTT